MCLWQILKADSRTEPGSDIRAGVCAAGWQWLAFVLLRWRRERMTLMMGQMVGAKGTDTNHEEKDSCSYATDHQGLVQS